MTTGYDYSRGTLLELFVRMQFPERTQRESALIRDFLTRHIHEYERYSFSVRVGRGLTPDPTHLSGIQFNSAHSTKKRIDLIAWRGAQPVIFEVKFRCNPAALGQLTTYRHLWMEDNPNEPEPELACIARYTDPDTARVFAAAGVPIYLYEAASDGGGNDPSRLPPDDEGAD